MSKEKDSIGIEKVSYGNAWAYEVKVSGSTAEQVMMASVFVSQLANRLGRSPMDLATMIGHTAMRLSHTQSVTIDLGAIEGGEEHDS